VRNAWMWRGGPERQFRWRRRGIELAGDELGALARRRGVASSGGASRGRDVFHEVPERLGGMPKPVRAAGGRGKPTAVAAQRLR
jgi:hypothetical protein